MNDDALLEELARLARSERDETAEEDARWADLAAGALTAAEETALRSEAETSPEAARAVEAYRPLDDDFRARMTALAASAIAAPERDDPSDPTDTGADADALPGPNVIDARRRWRRRGPGLALAAALLLAVLWPAGSGPPLPEYALQIGGGVQIQRSVGAAGSTEGATTSDVGRHVFADGNRLSLVWTPSTAVTDELIARVFTLHDGELTALDLPTAEYSEAGAVRLEAEIGGEVDWPAGESSLVVVVARADAFPDLETLRARSKEASPFRAPDWIAWTIPVRRP